MSKAKKTTVSSDEHKLIIAYIAANLIYDIGQRPAVVQNNDNKRVQEEAIGLMIQK